jgi:cellulose synthase/poly-beta-1,6-N-acetylglucosamine synthase-like glycosyltransferase
MKFRYTPFPEDPRELAWHKALCRLPMAATWSVLLVMGVSALAFPSVGAALIIAFLLFYIFRVTHNALFLALAFLRVLSEERSDWIGRLHDLAAVATGDSVPRYRDKRGGLVGRLADLLHSQIMETCRARPEPPPDFGRLIHLVIIPVSNEGREVFEPALRALAAGTLDPKRHLIVVLSVEERSAPEIREGAEAVRRAYGSAFRDFLVALHPADLPGEVPGKGSNVSCTAQRMCGYLRRRSLDFSDVLLTCLDADAVVSKEYFACLSYYYLAEPDRTRCCFQPLSVFSNNIWKTNSLVRVIEMSQTVFQMIDSTSIDTLVTFSCYSYSFAALAESGFWPPDVIGEDAAVFWKTFLYYGGDFKAIPLPVTVSMDAAEGSSFWKTLRMAYRQKLRWAYGTENLAIVFRGLFRHRLVRGRRRRQAVLKFVDNTLAQATWPFILSVLIWIPQAYQVLAQSNPLPVFNLGRISVLIFQLSGVFLGLMVLVTGFFAFRGSRAVPIWKKLLYPLEWLIALPIASILLGAAPAIHAHARLAFRKPIVYVPMEKLRGETAGGAG